MGRRYHRSMADDPDSEVPEADRLEQMTPTEVTSGPVAPAPGGPPAPEVPEADWLEQQMAEPDPDEDREG